MEDAGFGSSSGQAEAAEHRANPVEYSDSGAERARKGRYQTGERGEMGFERSRPAQGMGAQFLRLSVHMRVPS